MICNTANFSHAITKITDKQPVLMQADELIHFEETNTVVAIGQVELSQGERILLADEITYQQETGTVVANGNVILLEPTGEVLFSSRVVLSDDLKDGTIKNMRLLLKDGSRLAANTAERQNGIRKVMKEAVFSPCQPCKDNPFEPLVWQIKAENVIHDEIKQDMEYENAVLELFDFPIFYLPYFTHPDPTVQRRSGILIPTLGHSDEKGFIYGQPYYHVIDSARDLRIEPVIYSREGLIIQSHYRHALHNGNFDLKTTGGLISEKDITSNDEQFGFKGSADLKATFSLDDTWRTSFDFEQSSNRDYQRKFRLDTKEILTSQAILEGFRSRNYLSLTAYKFQGLRSTDDRRRQPIVLPAINYNFVGEPNTLGDRFRLNLSMRSLAREIGTDNRKFSMLSSWQLPYYSPIGEVYNLTALIQSDVFFSNNIPDDTKTEITNDHTKLRAIPQIALNWRYPFVRTTEKTNQVLEPTVNIVLGPNVTNKSEISNEDSQAFEFDDTNIFELNRYDGTDRITGGSRIDYGLKASLFNFQTMLSEIFLSQSYRFWGQSSFEDGTGLEHKRSDYVGRVLLSSDDWVSLIYRFRLDKDSFTPRRSELGLSLVEDGYSFVVDYALLDEQLATKTFGNREQLDFKLSARINQEWSSSVQLVQDLSNSSNRTRKASLGLTYSDECFTLGLEYQRKDLSDDALDPEDQVLLLVNFRNLGTL
tara:strand:+ start:895 stop:3012 length:2118 start_codon:yes stop_codon:yes gene_type:complete